MLKIYTILLVYLMIKASQCILLKVQKNKIKCYSVELDSEKLLELKFKILAKDQKCHIRLNIKLRTSYQEYQQLSNNQIFARGFQCESKQQQYFIQKFSDQHYTGISKFKICLNTLIANQPILVELILNEKVNPRFLDRNQELSLVTSIQLRNLHDNIIKVSDQLVSMQHLQTDFLQTQEQLTNANIQLKQDLKKITIFQSTIILVMGIIWIMILRSAKS